MKRREWASLIILALAAVPALLVAIGQVYVTGVDGIRLRRTETIDLLTEIAVLFFLYLFTIWKIESNRIRTGAVLLITAGFLWIHQAFTAMILSGAYVLVLLMLGARIRRGMDREHRWREYHVITGLADFLLGSGFMICLFCLGSLFFGCGITSFRFLTVVIAGLLAGYRMMELRAAGDSGMPWKRVPQRTRISLEMSICIALMFAMILLQAGRMNICADYDSLHYGLRNEYVLDNGGGIYENLGMVNVVYTYSKGLETLLLPISGLPSYGFFLSFQIWMTVGTLIAAGQIVELFVGRRYAVRCMTLSDDACVKANGTCIFNGDRWNGGALYPAHETAEISTEGKFSFFLYLYDPDVASHLVPDMAAYGTSADIRVQLDLGGPRIYREVPVPI